MARCVVGYANAVDRGAVTAGSELGTLPAVMLQEEHVAHVWRTASGVTSTRITCDFGAPATIGATALMNCNLSAAGTKRVRLSNSDPTGATGEIYSIATTAAGVDPDYGYLVHVFPTPVTGRYLRIDLADATLPFVEAGRWFAGTAFRPEINYRYGWALGYADPSARSRTLGGQTWINARQGWRVGEFEIPLSAAEREQHALPLQRQHGVRSDILFVRDPLSPNLGRETLWGLIEAPVPLPNPAFGRFSLRLSIEERL